MTSVLLRRGLFHFHSLKKYCPVVTLIKLHTQSNMFKENRKTYLLSEVVNSLNSFAPPSLAESWDNVGLLVEPSGEQKVNRILLTNDLTEEVLDEAIKQDVQLILSYHPPIFAPLKRITQKTWKERIVSVLLENRIALYSPHTSWDSVEGGVNDWLAGAFGKNAKVEPIHQQFTTSSASHVLEANFLDASDAESAAMEICKFPSLSASLMTDKSLSVFCNVSDMPALTKIVKSAHDFKFLKIEQKAILNHGSGRKVTLEQFIDLETAIDALKKYLNLPDLSVAVAKNQEGLIGTVALCAGSGASVLNGVKADLYVTGEMQHHDVLDAVHRGTHVILTRHSNSERGFLSYAAVGPLAKHLPGVQFIVSQFDKDPLKTM